MEKEIGKIPKNSTTDIVLRIDDFGGRTGLTIREFVTGDRYIGFTKSGVRIPAEEFSRFKEMINSIDEEDLKPAEEELPQLPPEQETLNEFEQEEIEIERPGKETEESETESEAEEESEEEIEEAEEEELPDY